jgi:hypothetical protein
VNMNYETWADFTDEWGDPDGLNFLVDISEPSPEWNIEGWTLYIANPRKSRIMEVSIEKATKEQIKKYAQASLKVIAGGIGSL